MIRKTKKKPNTRLEQLQEEKIRQLLRQGKPQIDIAREVEVSPFIVNRIANPREQEPADCFSWEEASKIENLML